MKITLRTILLFLFSLFTVSCKKEEPASFSQYTQISLYYKSVNNSDLLDPAKTGSILAGDIDIYYLKEGIRERVFYNNLDNPENFRIRKDDDGRYYLHLGLSEYPNANNLSTTYIEFNNGALTDTIKAEIVKKKTMIHYEKLWYNSILKFDPASSPFPKIEIVK